jgi:Uma2 family endonuclease
MTTVLLDQGIEIPTINSLAEFRRWALSDEFPERGRIDYVAGRIEVDMSPEDLFTHGTLKTVIGTRVHQRVEALDLGHTFIGETRISSVPGDVSAEPDVVVLPHAALEEGRVVLTPKASGQPDRFVEVEGGPDLIVEILSDSSERKDLRRLPTAYFQAGVREFWLMDARAELMFAIQGRGADSFQSVPADPDGFQRSAVLDTSFRLERTRHQRGHWVYRLQETR